MPAPCIQRSCHFFFQAEDGIRDAQESRGLGDVYKIQPPSHQPDRQYQGSLEGGVYRGGGYPQRSRITSTFDPAQAMIEESLGAGTVQTHGRRIAAMRDCTAQLRTFSCLLYTSDAADEEDSVDLGARRIIKIKNRAVSSSSRARTT
eukprot:TRINITY_DN65927_c0_g1_i1.p1 TRINITY_DN65927_c0_g1~~TRINITY_DN65927_c0_g1_i1.p1  ORF type:complete len:147 (+),score=20.48 TRINITY_DN65927_c0_g1_i1:98-538(+)